MRIASGHADRIVLAHADVLRLRTLILRDFAMKQTELSWISSHTQTRILESATPVCKVMHGIVLV